jgi:hypothetical protein
VREKLAPAVWIIAIIQCDLHLTILTAAEPVRKLSLRSPYRTGPESLGLEPGWLYNHLQAELRARGLPYEQTVTTLMFGAA